MTFKFAKEISIILLVCWIPLVLAALIYKQKFSGANTTVLVPALLILLLAIPAGYTYLAVKLKWITSWDIPIKAQRHAFYLILFLCTLTSVLLTNIYGNPYLFHLMLILFLISTTAGLMSYFWKISLHMIINTLGATFVNFIFNWQLLWLYLVLLLVFWDRLKLKRHTPPQLIAGFLLSISITLGVLWYFNYL